LSGPAASLRAGGKAALARALAQAEAAPEAEATLALLDCRLRRPRGARRGPHRPAGRW
jgi:hypothetical protein